MTPSGDDIQSTKALKLSLSQALSLSLSLHGDSTDKYILMNRIIFLADNHPNSTVMPRVWCRLSSLKVRQRYLKVQKDLIICIRFY
jgi:hypothetical protein